MAAAVPQFESGPNYYVRLLEPTRFSIIATPILKFQ
jgi:hypothetical protein